MTRRVWVAFLIALTIAASLKRFGLAQADLLKTRVEYSFGNRITFLAEIQASAPIETAMVFFQAHNDPHTSIGLATVEEITDGLYGLSYTHSLEDYHLRAFSRVDYHWEINHAQPDKQQFPQESFEYIDNRFEWNSLEEQPFKVHWYDETGDVRFAQSVIDAAQAGYQVADDLLPLTIPSKSLEIYVYPDSETMQAALRPTSENWVAGHADADLGVIVVSLPPGPDQKLLIEQRIPHELMHILLYQYTDPGYANLPTWLNEGLASQVELYPNSDYPFLLEDAVKREALIPMSQLCQTFPREASAALLSYAQAASFTKYLHSTYGTTGLVDLVKAYANGLDCERGAEQALGKSLTQLERAWRNDVLAEDTAMAALNNLLPWLFLLAAVLVAPFVMAMRRLKFRSKHRPAEQRTGQA